MSYYRPVLRTTFHGLIVIQMVPSSDLSLLRLDFSEEAGRNRLVAVQGSDNLGVQHSGELSWILCHVWGSSKYASTSCAG